MQSFVEFSALLDAEEDLFINLGEMGDESISLQEEFQGVITFDRYAEAYAKYLKKNGILNCFIGVENSDGVLQILEIKNGSVLYKMEAIFNQKFKINLL